ncbi:hypothetical protein J6TS1_06750 [Siminovitchia terrae]|uniref:Heterocycloanthracin/sonorensin family bacteriocin n=1 Tax=Siminovitchia terrae TaxID=1914933 RepID=A0A429XBE6_SIMTE|nr:heterocycloanthracin/sonorensin family bacteriocin [Siminovitchia terrae]RST60679.1 heterocycloanthracin/sonorensin family bacteriocin [Siminovitchia terrae]GIN91268.1 hypothetical protein J22TS1_23190 [Siminovitchia terrae]GIN94805.1 hypothetical protein J6TS1_06750 [Siminovitchia terrae]
MHFQNELQGLAMGNYHVGELIPMTYHSQVPLQFDSRQCGRCGGCFRCGGFRCGGCFGLGCFGFGFGCFGGFFI